MSDLQSNIIKVKDQIDKRYTRIGVIARNTGLSEREVGQAVQWLHEQGYEGVSEEMLQAALTAQQHR